VVHGHTHRAEAVERGGVLYVNPGSTTRPRGAGPASVARLLVDATGGLRAEIVAIGPA
jgi:predicted phosphodiesterase